MQRFVDLGALRADRDVAVCDADVESGEERGEEFSADVVGELLVESSGVFEQVDEGVGLLDAALDALDGADEFLGDRAFLQGHGFESLAELRDREVSVGGEFDESFLLVFELLELLAERILLLLVGGLQFDQCPADFFSDGRDLFRVEAFSGDAFEDFIFEFVEARGWHTAVPALLGGADVVLVYAAVGREERIGDS